MICVACNLPASLESVAKWKAEIQEIEPEKPIALILTKSDLADVIDDAIEFDTIKSKRKEQSLQIAAETSSKVWEDFNVHKAFNKTLTAAYAFKYELA